MAGTFIQVVVISRSLSLNDAGVVFLLFTMMNLAATVGRFGTDNLVLRRIASRQPGYDSEARWLRATCWMVSGIAGASIFGLLATGLIPLPAAGHGVLEAACVGLMTVCYALNVFAGAVLRGAGRVVAGILAELGIAPWLTILFVGGQLVFAEPTVVSVLFSLLAAGAITALWALKSAGPAISSDGRMDWLGGMFFIRGHLSSLASLMGTSLLFFALVWVPQLVLGLVGTGVQVAQYTAAARIASFISIFPGVQTSYLAPRFAALAYGGRRKDLSAECGRAALQALMVAVPLLVTISAAPQLFLNLFGGGYTDAAIPTLILCIGAYIGLVFGPVNVIMLTAGLERTALILNSFLLAALATFTVMATPRMGVTGIALASAACGVIYGLVACVLIIRRLRVNPTLFTYFRPEILANVANAASGQR